MAATLVGFVAQRLRLAPEEVSGVLVVGGFVDGRGG